MCIFEFTNACQHKKASKIQALAASGKLSREEYAQAVEGLEMDTWNLRRNIEDKCIKQEVWKPSMSTRAASHDIKKAHLSADDLGNLLATQEVFNHTENYRTWWSKAYKNVFCSSNNSLHDDCTAPFMCARSFERSLKIKGCADLMLGSKNIFKHHQSVLDNIPAGVKNDILNTSNCFDQQ